MKYISFPRVLEIMGAAENTATQQDLLALISETATDENQVKAVDDIEYISHEVLDAIAHEGEGATAEAVYGVWGQISAEFADLPQPKPAETRTRRRRGTSEDAAPAGEKDAEEKPAEEAPKGRRRRGAAAEPEANESDSRIAAALRGVPSDNPPQEPSKVIEAPAVEENVSPSEGRTRELVEQSKGYNALQAHEEKYVRARIVALEAELEFLKAKIA